MRTRDCVSGCGVCKRASECAGGVPTAGRCAYRSSVTYYWQSIKPHLSSASARARVDVGCSACTCASSICASSIRIALAYDIAYPGKRACSFDLPRSAMSGAAGRGGPECPDVGWAARQVSMPAVGRRPQSCGSSTAEAWTVAARTWWTGGGFQGANRRRRRPWKDLVHVVVPGSTWSEYCDTSCLCGVGRSARRAGGLMNEDQAGTNSKKEKYGEEDSCNTRQSLPHLSRRD